MTGQEKVQHVYPIFSSYRKSPEHLSHISVIQKILRGSEVAPGPKQLSSTTVPRSPIPCHSSSWSTRVTFLGLPKSHLDVPKGQSCQQVTMPVLFLDRSPGGIRAGQRAFHCFSAKQPGELSWNLGNRGSSCSSSTANPQLELCATLPQGRMDLGHRLAPFPCSQEKAGWKPHRENQLPFPIPSPDRATLSVPK